MTIQIDFGGEGMTVFERNMVCPLCKSPLINGGGSFYCTGERRHNFDIAKSGYVNFNTHASSSGDDKEMALARQSFLRKGYYERLSNAVCHLAGGGELLCDAGCGEGYYTEALAGGFDAVIGADLSKHALTLAAKSARQVSLSHKLLYTVASVYSLPLADGSADAVVNIFAPCVEAEYKRVLKCGGRLVIAAAGRDHLTGLKELLYDTVIPNEERHDYPKGMKLDKTVSVKYDADIDGEDIYSLFTMTPYFYRTKKESVERLRACKKLSTPLDFEVRMYVKEE